jgi:hypothetical protein
MKSNSGLLSVIVTTHLLLSVSAAHAAEPTLASPQCDTPPLISSECADGSRNEASWNSGVSAGRSAVQRIWGSAAVNKDPCNWDILVEEVTETIPGVAASLYSIGFSQFIQCRLQGYLDGTMYAMRLLKPLPQCIWCGLDWGRLSKKVYCHLSVQFGGFAGPIIWFFHRPEGVCEDQFQSSCESAHHAAGDQACAFYTGGAFASVYADSVHRDCH